MYGFWALAASFIGSYGLMHLGLGSAVDRYLAAEAGKGNRDEYTRIFSTGLQLCTALGLVALAVTLMIASLAPLFTHNPQDAALFEKVIVILGFSVALGFPMYSFQGLLEAELRLDALAVVDLFTLLLRTALIVAALLAGYKLLALAWVTLLSGLPGNAAYVLLARRQCPWLRFHFQPWFGEWTKRLFSYGVFACLARLAEQAKQSMPALVIAALLSLGAVTHFRIAGLMLTYFTTLMLALLGTIQPWFSRKHGAGDHQAIRTTFLFTTKLSLATAAFVSFGFVAWGKPFIERWMGRSYLDAYPCLVVLALGAVVSLGQGPIAQFAYATSRVKFYAAARSAGVAVSLLLSVWLVRPLGILGVALAVIFPAVPVDLVVLPLYVCRAIGIPYGNYMWDLVKSLLKIAAALALPALISVCFAAPTYLSLALVGLASAGCYIIAVAFLNFSKQERGLLRRGITSGTERNLSLQCVGKGHDVMRGGPKVVQTD